MGSYVPNTSRRVLGILVFFCGGKPLPRSCREFFFSKIFGVLNFFRPDFFRCWFVWPFFYFKAQKNHKKHHYFVKNDHFEHTLASKDQFRFILVRYEPAWIAYPIQPVPVHTGSGYRFRFRFWCFLDYEIRPPSKTVHRMIKLILAAENFYFNRLTEK